MIIVRLVRCAACQTGSSSSVSTMFLLLLALVRAAWGGPWQGVRIGLPLVDLPDFALLTHSTISGGNLPKIAPTESSVPGIGTCCLRGGVLAAARHAPFQIVDNTRAQERTKRSSARRPNCYHWRLRFRCCAAQSGALAAQQPRRRQDPGHFSAERATEGVGSNADQVVDLATR